MPLSKLWARTELLDNAQIASINMSIIQTKRSPKTKSSR